LAFLISSSKVSISVNDKIPCRRFVIPVCVNQVFFSTESTGYEPEERHLITTAPSHETTTRNLVIYTRDVK
jgi:hypothetical protein